MSSELSPEFTPARRFVFSGGQPTTSQEPLRDDLREILEEMPVEILTSPDEDIPLRARRIGPLGR